MAEGQFRALVVEEIELGKFIKKIKNRSLDSLPQDYMLIKVMYSALNYKDALSASGHKGITRIYPHTPGVDAAGVVVESSSSKFLPGAEVLVTGYDLGMNTSGGFGQYIRVPESWIVPVPGNMSIRETMIYGTAGFTAGICIYELQKYDIFPGSGKILVTGATGGVGSLTVAMLAKAGYYVIASTGKMDKQDFLKQLGAKEIIHRSEVYDTSDRALLQKRWLGAIDTVGGRTLSTVIRSTDRRGAVCCLGLVESDRLETTVYPFILRGITLIGIDSAERPMDVRMKIWDKISTEWRIENPEMICKEITLDAIIPEIEKILIGQQTGKILVNLWK